MQFVVSLRNFSLGVATAAFLMTGAAWGATTQTATRPSWHLVGVNARLGRRLDTKTARAGQSVEAKLDSSVRTAQGMELPKGTELWGRVDHVVPSMNGSPASLSLVFTTAELRDGKRLPVKVTLLGACPPGEGYPGAYSQADLLGPAPKQVSSRERVDQRPGMLQDISMHSAVPSHNSATFQKKNGNFALHAGTYLQVAIGPRTGHAGTMTSSGA